MRLHRRRDREQHSANQAERTPRRRDAQANPKRIKPPNQGQDRDCDKRRHDHFPQEIRIDGQEECNRIRIENHHVDEIDRHQQLVVLEHRKLDQCEDQRQ